MTRNTSGLWLDLCMSGVAADRPNIPSPVPQTFQLYHATDTGDISLWDGGAWSLIGSSNGGVTSQGADALTASTTQTLVGALAMTAKYNRIGTVANSGDAVKLPPLPQPGAEVWVYNSGANPAKVFPGNAADIIDAVSAGGSVTVTNAKGALFACVAAGKWVSFGIAAHAA